MYALLPGASANGKFPRTRTETDLKRPLVP